MTRKTRDKLLDFPKSSLEVVYVIAQHEPISREMLVAYMGSATKTGSKLTAVRRREERLIFKDDEEYWQFGDLISGKEFVRFMKRYRSDYLLDWGIKTNEKNNRE